MSSDLKESEVGYFILESLHGFRYIKVQCPMCKIWVDGPVFIQKGNVHFLETWPAPYAHEKVEITSIWEDRLSAEAEVPIEKLCIHVEVADLHLHPDFPAAARVRYFRSGQEIVHPAEYLKGRFDGVLISLFPESDQDLKKIEKLIVHELVHVAFPNAGGTRIVEGNPSLEEIYKDPICEEWVKKKTRSLLKKFGFFSLA